MGEFLWLACIIIQVTLLPRLFQSLPVEFAEGLFYLIEGLPMALRKTTWKRAEVI